ncbi:AAA family ATPase [Sulfurovum sp. bin170]|uniref:AAA family ATPase n=1 Tax=Sulfurovum sp. bin170 TaxID=2695268 RepID=UPI0013E0A0F9|nr:AAA family ATPase [Sulfurovum sp. bin170]NEW61314.1 AAA family ATPase [Sulfurovum sp. bin170]
MKKLPYGKSNFKDIKTKGYYYIDKTNFIQKIEDSSDFLFFLRPRRFGKSLLISMLEAYYDIYYRDEFNEIFKDTYILKNPTPLKSSFYIMKFDFSGVNVTDYQNSFRVNLLDTIDSFLEKYEIERSFRDENPINRLHNLFQYFTLNRLSLYILIDEYDSFVNKLLVNDTESYKDIVSTNEALYKDFFTILKVGTSGNDSAIKKMFFTGVSPLALYDVTSGSNIGESLSLEYDFNDMVGVTRAELDKMIDDYALDRYREQIFQRCDEWYDSYRFNKRVSHTIYNTDMILYYLKSLIRNAEEPNNLIDINVRSDYTKLRYLVYSDKKLNGNFEILNSLINNETITLDILQEYFTAYELKKSVNFISFLFSLGFITIKEYRAGIQVYIPNQTIKKIMADFITMERL